MKAWHVVLISLALAMAICGAGVFFLGRAVLDKGRELDKQAKAFGTEALGAILTNWDWAAAERYAGPELFGGDKVSAQLVFNSFRDRLGPFKSLGAPTFVGFNSSSANGVATDVVDLRYPAEFANGPATVRIKVVRRDGAWRLIGLKFDSRVLAGNGNRT
ncbi:MAG: hypothetical protein HY248_03670 [Fimbriimonas ginsengisoli]|uniref:DUF4019 domain-containing protein n=1 Tax=Fimbriimonas ginsengisoli TaxID=1005039 RepID=A0A931LSD6_FIMGI|nr:hypothetical protein [Fimbriimonas ginsengisoli]MBI3721629.1 hypothetical protein [Fimbriimonas ginsengisoli]